MIKLETFNYLSNTERNLFLFSLPVVNKNLDFFVVRFYNYFLENPAVKMLFKTTNMKHQHKMFNTAINVILTHIAEPSLLEAHLGKIAESHKHYGIMDEYIEYFKDAFMEALKETLPEKSDNQILSVWYKILTEIMEFFRIKSQ